MALNFSREINRKVAINCIRLLQNNIQKLNQLSNALDESTQSQNLTQKAKKFNKFAISSQFRTTPPENLSLRTNSFQAEQVILERNLQSQYLQPATLPSFKDKTAYDKHPWIIPQEEQIKNAESITTNTSASQRIMERFKQKLAKNLSSRLPRLSLNPCPEPIKAIFSTYTFSDQEKAEQMFQDQRMAYVKPTESFSANPSTIRSIKKFYCTKSQSGATQNHSDGVQRFNSRVSGTSWVDQVRSFSKSNEGSGVCGGKQKSGGLNKLKRWKKMTIKGCPPAASDTICKPRPKEVKCTKVEAPYPSFSESCYIEPKERGKTECDICPWNQRSNPSFRGKLKIPPKFYHTDCSPSSIRTSNIMPEAVSLGYCDRNPTPLSEFFMENGDLLRNFRNGDDLSAFGVKKSTLSRILSSADTFNIVCKKGGKIVPEYPKNCNETYYKDESKNCPKDLHKQKTNKERLKRKDPKNKTN